MEAAAMFKAVTEEMVVTLAAMAAEEETLSVQLEMEEREEVVVAVVTLVCLTLFA